MHRNEKKPRNRGKEKRFRVCCMKFLRVVCGKIFRASMLPSMKRQQPQQIDVIIATAIFNECGSSHNFQRKENFNATLDTNSLKMKVCGAAIMQKIVNWMDNGHFCWFSFIFIFCNFRPSFSRSFMTFFSSSSSSYSFLSYPVNYDNDRNVSVSSNKFIYVLTFKNI